MEGHDRQLNYNMKHSLFVEGAHEGICRRFFYITLILSLFLKLLFNGSLSTTHHHSSILVPPLKIFLNSSVPKYFGKG
jgi:hypothetical protein